MGTDQWNREEEGSDNLSVITRIDDPLAELFVELALCIDAAEQSLGCFCSHCTCKLGYHLTCDDGVCENCDCDEIHWLCTSCGTSRSIEKYAVGSRVCKYCIDTPPIKIRPEPIRATRVPAIYLLEGEQNYRHMLQESTRERAKAARMVLKDLDE